MNGNLLPAIIVRTSPRDYQKHQGGGGGTPKEFVDVEQAQQSLVEYASQIRDELRARGPQSSLKVGLAQIQLREGALEKSHRPIETFNERTCPLIGDDDGTGVFLTPVSPEGIERLIDRIHKLHGRTPRAHWTGIASFRLRGAEQRLPLDMQKEIEQQLARAGSVRLRIQLPRFELFTPVHQVELENQLLAIEGVNNAPYIEQGDFLVYAAQITHIEQALQVATLEFIDRIDIMPRYTPAAIGTIDLADIRVAVDALATDAPIVAIVDGGIDPTVLDPLVWQYDRPFPDQEYDLAHGTAVAALVASQDDLRQGSLNPRCRFLDARIIRSGEQLLEDDLIARLENAVKHYHESVRIWCLALSAIPGKRRDEFSVSGRFLDGLQKRYHVVFFLAAGNCQQWREHCLMPSDADREEWITMPGDSICNVTVGAYAAESAPGDGYFPIGAPSSFTPHGPGPQSSVKPDILASGGNGNPPSMVGVPTLSRSGRVIEKVGTSFATPQVAGMAVEVLDCLERSAPLDDIAILLTRTMLLHHAHIPAALALGGNFSDYYGYGLLSPLEVMLGDPLFQSTSFVIATLYPHEDLLLDPFPFPADLHRNGRFFGEISLTMVSDPILNYGQRREYVRSNVEVKFAMTHTQSDGTAKFESLQQVQHMHGAYERSPKEYKWVPIKQYRIVFPREGARGNHLRLYANLQLRGTETGKVTNNPALQSAYGVPVVIALTIQDPTQQGRVSPQMVQQWQALGYAPIQLEIAQRVRPRFT